MLSSSHLDPRSDFALVVQAKETAFSDVEFEFLSCPLLVAVAFLVLWFGPFVGLRVEEVADFVRQAGFPRWRLES